MPETEPRVYDAVVVLGKNLGFGWNANKIRSQRDHLAPHGRMNTLAGGILLEEGRAKKVILSSGITVPNLPSEAQLMKNKLHQIWPAVPDENIILEEVSKQTRGNAREVKRVLEEQGIDPQNVGLVTMGFHMDRAQRFFQEEGLHLDPLPSEEIVARKFPRLVSAYKRKAIYIGERIMEAGYRIIQSIPVLKDIAEAKVEKDRS
jgi:uncharacterized SAM-binding protein YcdF (DUF218 family)